MINYLRPEILNLSSYTPSLASKGITKLDAMESPFELSDNLKNEWLEIMSNIALNRYPGSHDALHETIKNVMNIDTNLEIMLGNGSDELIQILMLGLQKDTEILSFTPSFVMYEMIAKWCNLSFTSLALTTQFSIDIDATLAHIDNNKRQVLFISYPNNPTGNAFDIKTIKQILATNTLVIIDEAYYAYTEHSFIDEINNYNNLIVLRTISKIGFAGLRLGIMIGTHEIINEYNKIRMPYNINNLSLASAQFVLKAHDEIWNNTKNIKENRVFLISELSKLPFIKTYSSDANFVLFSLETLSPLETSNTLFECLKTNNILIKNMQSIIPGALRVTVGTRKENQIFIEVVSKFCNTLQQ